VATFEQARSQRGQLALFLKAIGLSRKKLDEHITNPFLTIPDRLARRCEQHLKKQKAWMDEQHVETDPVCASFPEDMRRMMIIYSELPAEERERLLRVIEAFNA
jgi:hypothetical protein